MIHPMIHILWWGFPLLEICKYKALSESLGDFVDWSFSLAPEGIATCKESPYLTIVWSAGILNEY